MRVPPKWIALALAMTGMTIGPQAQADDDLPVTVNIRTEGSGAPIVVTGDRELERDRVRDAVRDIAMRGRSQTDALVRYTDPLCVTAIGLGERLGAGLRRRIEAHSRLAGHPVAAAGCRTNALIVIVDEPARLIERLRGKRRDLFDPAANRRIRATLRRGYPAVTWSIAGTLDRYGNEMENGAAIGGLSAPGAAGDLLLQRDSRAASRLGVPFARSRTMSVIVFEAKRLHNVHLDQLADYATMRILGNPQPYARLSEEQPETILNLFRTDPLDAAPGLTLIDMAYLRGLYSVPPGQPSTRLEHFTLAAYRELAQMECDDAAGCNTDPG